MGLDMYLTKRIWYGGEYKKDDEQTLSFVGPFATEHNIDSRNVEEIVVKGAYWRKANAIHGWFDMECGANSPDSNCQDLFVSGEQLIRLYELCKRTLTAYNDDDYNKCEELLPPCEGFSFGTYNIDEWYKQDLEHTIEQLKPIIENKDIDKYDFYYKASW